MPLFRFTPLYLSSLCQMRRTAVSGALSRLGIQLREESSPKNPRNSTGMKFQTNTRPSVQSLFNIDFYPYRDSISAALNDLLFLHVLHVPSLPIPLLASCICYYCNFFTFFFSFIQTPFRALWDRWLVFKFPSYCLIFHHVSMKWHVKFFLIYLSLIYLIRNLSLYSYLSKYIHRFKNQVGFLFLSLQNSQEEGVRFRNLRQNKISHSRESKRKKGCGWNTHNALYWYFWHFQKEK